MKRIRVVSDMEIDANNAILDVKKPVSLYFDWGKGGKVTVVNNSTGDVTITGRDKIDDLDSYTVSSGETVSFEFEGQYYVTPESKYENGIRTKVNFTTTDVTASKTSVEYGAFATLSERLNANDKIFALSATDLDNIHYSINKYPLIVPEADDTPRIKRAVAAVGRNHELYFPPGEYYISDYVDVEGFSHIKGGGRDRTIIHCTIAASGFRASHTTGIYHFKMSNLSLDGDDIAETGLDMINARECVLNDCYIRYFNYGVKMLDSWSNALNDCDVSFNRTNNIFFGQASNDISLVNIKLDGAGVDGVVVDGLSDCITFNSCVFQSCGQHGLRLASGSSITLINPHFENNNLNNVAGVGDINVQGSTDTITTFNMFGGAFYGTNSKYAVRFDTVFKANLIGVSYHGSFANKLVTTANTGIVYEMGANNNSIAVNDDVSFSIATLPLFRQNLSVEKSFPIISLNSYDSTSVTSRHSVGGTSYFEMQSKADGKTYIKHYNGTTFEDVITIDTQNRLVIPHQIKEARMDAFTTSTRPSSPEDYQYGIDTTISKIIWYRAGVWKDAMGNVV